MKLPHILHNDEPFEEVNLEMLGRDTVVKAAQFWVGKQALKASKHDLMGALRAALKNEAARAAALTTLSPAEREVLSVVVRYGPVISGNVLSTELVARELVQPEERRTGIYYSSQKQGLVWDLREKLLLLSESYSSYWYAQETYPNLELNPLVAGIAAAAPLTWKPSAPAPQVTSSVRRSSAEVALGVWHVADALREIKAWHTVRGEMLAQGSQKRLQKLAPMTSAEQDPFCPPDPQCLFYELLHQMFLLSFVENRVDVGRLEVHSRQPAALQAWEWVRAWMNMELWQDGIGVVPDRDNDNNPVRIDPDSLLKVKERLIWSLCRVAHSPPDWLELESFLKDFHYATRGGGRTFYWSNYTWEPGFESTRTKNALPGGEERSYAYWLDSEGTWIANALFVTLVTLGLVERGESGDQQKPQHCFRLTELGRAVFGAPEIESQAEAIKSRFLTVQPNHEILAYLDAATATDVSMLTRIAERDSGASGQVQKFTLRRETIYRALESGLTLEQIRAFLAEHGKTPVPENVSRALSDWTSKRESLVLRTGVILAVAPSPLPLSDAKDSARALSEMAAVLAPMSEKQVKQQFPGSPIINHNSPLAKSWTADERGRIRENLIDSVSRMRLASIAAQSAEGWQITEDSVAAARKQGLTGDQILEWLKVHLEGALPPLLETALRNWTGRVPAFLGKVQLLQITRPQAKDVILTSPLFEPLLAGHIPPNWFIVRDDKVTETKRLLKELGFAASETYQFKAPEDSPAPVKKAKPKAKKRKRRGY